MFNCRMASYNRLTLGPAPSDRRKSYTSERDSQRIFRLVNPRSSEFLFCGPFLWRLLRRIPHAVSG